MGLNHRSEWNHQLDQLRVDLRKTFVLRRRDIQALASVLRNCDELALGQSGDIAEMAGTRRVGPVADRVDDNALLYRALTGIRVLHIVLVVHVWWGVS